MHLTFLHSSSSMDKRSIPCSREGSLTSCACRFLSRLRRYGSPSRQTLGTPMNQPLCPYCSATLPSSRAKQCLKCHRDWHDPENVQQANVSPDWNVFGLSPEKTYVVELCQEPNGHRFTMYREIPCGTPNAHAVFETDSAKGSAFIEWGYYSYAKHLKLSNGEAFGFEAHGIWLTSSEIEYLFGTPSAKLVVPPWVNGLAPNLPPC